jgi:hypothetical protein
MSHLSLHDLVEDSTAIETHVHEFARELGDVWLVVDHADENPMCAYVHFK